MNQISIAYLFRKTEDNEFRHYLQWNADRADERFLVQFIGNGYPPEKLYVPVGTSQLIESLDKRELADLAVRAIPELARRLARRLGIR
jgi:mannose-6-phosphate isomerase-like protein (cupin superfamily)